jgi:predicted AAA+ superfamily ATPase
LPYTAEFDALKRVFQEQRGSTIGDAAFWKLLSGIGKTTSLKRDGVQRKGTKAPKLDEPESLELLRLFPDGMGGRDALPYTTAFDAMRKEFIARSGRTLSRHEFWRAISNLAKGPTRHPPVFENAPIGDLSKPIVNFLEDTNPWWRGRPSTRTETFRRWAFDEMVRRLDKPTASMVVIRGSRRVGKTVLQQQLVQSLLNIGSIDPTGKPVDPARILRVQFDDAPALTGISMPIAAIIRWYEQHVLGCTLNEAAARGEPAYLLFDEVQNQPDWSTQLKFLGDTHDARIVVTGSSALRIEQGKDTLAGRMDTIELGPLRLREIAGIRKLGSIEPFQGPATTEAWKERDFWMDLIAHGERNAGTRDAAFGWFSLLGGYPMCHNTRETDTARLRQAIVSGVIDKTIQEDPIHPSRSTTLDTQLVRAVFQMACRYAGQAVRNVRFAEELSQLAGERVAESRVEAALEFLAASLLLYRVPAVDMLAKKGGHPPKRCICDHFVRDGVLQETLPLDPAQLSRVDQAVAGRVGNVIESVLGYFLKGIPGVDLSWFPERTNEPEVDFILSVGPTRIPVEVKYRRGGPEQSDLRGIESFCAKPAYQAPFGLIITQEASGPMGEHAIAVPAKTFMLLR